MVAQSTVIKYDILRTVASSTLSGTYAKIGNEFAFPMRIVKIVNDSTEAITVSVDGTNDNDYVRSGSETIYYIGTNRGNSSPELNLPPTQFYAKGTAGTGNIYVVGLYANTPNPGIPL